MVALKAAVVALATAIVAVPAAEAGPSRAHVTVDAATGRVLDSHAADRVMHPASLTKMMTLYLVFEAVKNGEMSLDDVLVTSRRAAAAPPSKLGLRRGKKITVRDAVRAAAVFSANDAAVVLAEAISGSERAFAKKMTRKARELGLEDTTFKNASGLTARGHLSTPRDMARLSRRLLNDFPGNYIVFGRTSVKIHGSTRRATNRLLRKRDDVDGIKTGYTAAAGFNLAATAKNDLGRVIVVLMGDRTRARRDHKVDGLLDVGLKKLAELPVLVGAAPKPRRRPVAEPASDLFVSAPVEPRRVGGARLVAASALAGAVQPTPRPMSKAPQDFEVSEIAAQARQLFLRSGPSTPSKPVRRAVAPRWGVQVGAYRDRDLARQRLQTVAALTPPALAAAAQRVEATNAARPHYRARFSGLDERAARAACGWLERRGVDCALVPPGGWGG